jgi:hypothetical protein
MPWISEPVPMSPISPSNQEGGIDAFEHLDRLFGLANILVKSKAERSKTTESNPALVAY